MCEIVEMSVWFVNGWVGDGLCEEHVSAGVLKTERRVEALALHRGALASRQARAITAPAATLIPGLIDARENFLFPVSTYETQIEDTPPEDTLCVVMKAGLLHKTSGRREKLRQAA